MAAVLTAALGVPAGSALADPGDLDPTFGGGLVKADLRDGDAEQVAVDSVGRVVVAGRVDVSETEYETLILRYTATGALDPAFGGGDGIVREPLPVGGTIAIDASDRILIGGGTESNHFAVARLTTDGQLDPSFGGGDGLAETTVPGVTTAVAIDGSGRIILQGGSRFMRLTEAGTPEVTFGESGVATLPPGLLPGGIAIDGAGRITTAGYVDGSKIGAARLLPGGELDPAFDENGLVATNIEPGSSDFEEAMTVDAGSRIVAVGITFLPSGTDEGQPFIVRYTPSGALDASFAGDGILTGNDEGRYNDIAIDSEGRLLIVGSSDELLLDGGDVLARYLPNGTLDPTFGGGDGFVPVGFGMGTAVAAAPDERIAVAGDYPIGEGLEFGVARYLGGDAQNPPSPPQNPTPVATTPSEPAGTPPLPPPSSKPRPKPKKCKRGFRKKKVHGKARCVKKHRHP